MGPTPTPSDLWRRGQRGWPASYPVAQLPNAPLLVALGGWLVAALTDGPAHACGRATFHVGLAAWAWEELADGANLLRRALGAAGLGYVVRDVRRRSRRRPRAGGEAPRSRPRDPGAGAGRRRSARR